MYCVLCMHMVIVVCVYVCSTKYKFFFLFNRRRRDLSTCKLTQWPDLVFQRCNIDVYVEQKRSKVNEKDQIIKNKFKILAFIKILVGNIL